MGRYIVQLITPKVPAMAVSTVIRIFKISFQFIFMVFWVNGESASHGERSYASVKAALQRLKSLRDG